MTLEADQDVLPESSPGADENINEDSSSSDLELSEQLSKRLDEVKQTKTKASDDGKTAKPDAAKEKAGDAKAQGEKADEKKAKGDEEKTVPLSALKSRVAEEKQKRVKLQEKHDALDIEHKKLKAAFDIVTDELKREREARLSGAKIDPKDDQLRRFELQQKAEGLEKQIADEAVKAREQAQHDDEVAELREQLKAEIAEAVGDESVISKAELIAALQDPRNTERSVKEIADEKIAIRTEAFKKRLVKEQPNFPTTARQRAQGHHGLRLEPTLESMDERLAQLKAQHALPAD